MYFQANNHLQGMQLAGSITFSLPGSPDDFYANPQPAVGPDGTIYANRFDVPQGLRLKAFDAGGNRLWTFFDAPTGRLATPDVGPDGIIYVVRDDSLYAANPDGIERWHYPVGGLLFDPAVSPNNDLIFLSGLIASRPGFLVGISAAGELRWRFDLPTESGDHNILPYSRARFANDGQTVYIGTAISGQQHGDEQTHSYLYAVQTVR